MEKTPPVPRLAWLDVLRGVAALTVAFHHGSYHFVPAFRAHLIGYVNPGAWGVLVFFLVSGYIIPASLERTGSVRRFWIGRAFRIHPMLLVAIGAMVVLSLTGLKPLGDHPEPVTEVLAHLTMLQDLLAVPSLINVFWTLSYEMVFYLLTVALFAVGLHRRSAGVALALAGSAAALAAVLPVAALSGRAGTAPVTAAVAALVATAIVLACSRRAALARAGALLGGATGLVLVLANSRIAAWQGLVLLAMMFLGTAVHRSEQGRLAWRWTVLAGAGVVGTALLLPHWHVPDMVDGGVVRAWDTSLPLAVAAFAAAMALRGRRMPRALAGLGVVSYSVYVLHPVVLAAADGTVGRPGEDRPLWLAAYLVLVVAVSAATYRLVEVPARRAGRRVARRLDPRPAPDRPSAPVTVR
ncbi:Acyltransferase family protein [Actinomadura rubteroloni]|uniref:Acyltransferase family protein n=1 Tax=Actinomadura rubteroloni TaxID=1926885 RepID=A0A2P4UE10_9ACTN|nr:acyltransferase [Actinomadura rubteroloni]POM23290.1 Acyltransferase family protein [Actinomadura rubteroloni]